MQADRTSADLVSMESLPSQALQMQPVGDARTLPPAARLPAARPPAARLRDTATNSTARPSAPPPPRPRAPRAKLAAAAAGTRARQDPNSRASGAARAKARVAPGSPGLLGAAHMPKASISATTPATSAESTPGTTPESTPQGTPEGTPQNSLRVARVLDTTGAIFRGEGAPLTAARDDVAVEEGAPVATPIRDDATADGDMSRRIDGINDEAAAARDALPRGSMCARRARLARFSTELTVFSQGERSTAVCANPIRQKEPTFADLLGIGCAIL